MERNPIKTHQYPTPAKHSKYSVTSIEKTERIFWGEVSCWEISLNKAIRILNMNKNLDLAIKASLEAGREIMKVYDSVINVEYKEDKSPLTEADTKANEVINFYLKQTEIPIISEENKQIDFEIRKNWLQCWIVDPVDGTKEFIKRNGEFTVNIALIENGRPLLGVIYAPANKTLYFGNVTNKQSFKVNLDSHSESIESINSNKRLLKPKQKGEIIEIIGSRSHMNQETLHYVETIKSAGKKVKIISKGSSLKFCLIAEGLADFYPRFAPTMEWDTAAGHAICNAVGVEVNSCKTNKSLLYNKENLINPWFLVNKN